MVSRVIEAGLDAIRERLFALLGDGAKDGASVVTLFSRTAREGVTGVSVGLARSVARSGELRVLLVDHDSSRRGAAGRFGTHARVFSGFVTNADGRIAQPRDALQRIEAAGLDLLNLKHSLPSGLPGERPWVDALAGLRASYDLILIDAGAISTPLALRWARLGDLRVLVVDASRTNEEELERLRSELHSIGQEVDAAVLNKRRYYVPGFLYRFVR